MGVHVYCVSPAAVSAGGVAGIDDVPVETHRAGDVAILMSAHRRAPAPSIDRVRRHNAVIEAAMNRESTPVPIRYGQWFDSAAAAIETMTADADRWRSMLERFAGRAEHGIRLLPADGPAREMHPPPVKSGTAYMAELARRSGEVERLARHAERLATTIEERAGAIIEDRRMSEAVGGGHSIAYLLAWDAVTEYSSIVRSMQDETDQRLLLTGPWPPYSFVE